MAKKIKTVTTTVTTEEIIDTNNEKTHIICILDRSGSMQTIMEDSIGGFNTFLRQQKDLPDKATITVALFDDKYEIIYDCVDIKKAEELTSEIWFPRGSTSLHDAIGKTINNEKAYLSKLGNNKPSKVLVCIITDGHENTSKEYKLDDIKKLIKECENNDWNFIYLAANQNAFDVGQGFGVSAGNTFTYVSSSMGVMDMSAKLSNATTSYRSMSTIGGDFKKMSKKLIDTEDDKNNPLNISGSITIDNSSTTIGGSGTTTSTTYKLPDNSTLLYTNNTNVTGAPI